MLRMIVGIFGIYCISSTPNAHSIENHKNLNIVTIRRPNDTSQIQQLIEEGYDIAGINFENQTIDVVASSTEQTMSLRLMGYKIHSINPIDTTQSPDPGYKTAFELETILKQFANEFGHIAHLETIGKSVQNQDIWAIKISDHPHERETNEPSILFNAMHHAREVMSTEVTLDIVDFLLSGYGVDPKVTKWVDNSEIWVVPMLNVDGNNKVWLSDNMWRKNVNNGHGVDLNRNYPFAWGRCHGSSGSPSSDTYRGPAAGSEPETQALMRLVARIQPTFDISYHSYSEIVIYPYGCDGERTETSEIVETLGHELGRVLRRDSGQGTYVAGTSWETLYAVDGGDIDWMYNEYHVIPFVIEVSSSSQGFQPPYYWRQPTVEKMRAGWQLLLDRLDQSGIRGLVTNETGLPIPNAIVSVRTLGNSQQILPISWQIKTDGTYHIVVKPGMYEMVFQTENREFSKKITIGSELLTLDVQL